MIPYQEQELLKIQLNTIWILNKELISNDCFFALTMPLISEYECH